MINIFEEAFKANSQLSKKSLNEAKVKKPKPDLSNNPKSITAILQKHKEELNKATSVKELYDLVSKWLKEEGVNTEASRRLLTKIASKNDITSAQFVVYNSILAGAGQEVIESKSGLKSEEVKNTDLSENYWDDFFEANPERKEDFFYDDDVLQNTDKIFRKLLSPKTPSGYAVEWVSEGKKDDGVYWFYRRVYDPSKKRQIGGPWRRTHTVYIYPNEDIVEYEDSNSKTRFVPMHAEEALNLLSDAVKRDVDIDVEENYTKMSFKKSVREDVDSFQPDEDILVVYNDKLDDNMSDDEIEDVISNSIDKCVCKCGICGANYIVNDDNFTAEDKSEVETTVTEESVKKTSDKSKTLDESMLFKGLSLLEADDEDLDIEDNEDLVDITDTAIEDDNLKDDDLTDNVEDVDEITSKEEENKCTCTCPICGATEQQSVIGTISEDDVITFDKDEESDDKTDEDDIEDKDDIKDEDDIEIKDDENFDDTSIEDVTSEETEEVDEPKVESKRRLRKHVKEAKDLDNVEDSEDIYAYSTREDPNPDPKFIISSNVDGEICRVSTKYDAKHTIEAFKIEDKRDKTRKKQNIVYTCTELDGTPCDFSINEKALNKLFTKFANENYENVKDVVFTNGKVLKDGNIKIEGIVNTKSGKVRSITLESIGFKLSPETKIIKFIEKGPFTESAKIGSNKVPFVVECTIRNKSILVKSLKYNYRLSESNNTYAVYGKHNLFENRKMNSK